MGMVVAGSLTFIATSHSESSQDLQQRVTALEQRVVALEAWKAALIKGMEEDAERERQRRQQQ